jgi:hypothetical protein
MALHLHDSIFKGGEVHDTARIDIIHERDSRDRVNDQGKVDLREVQVVAVVPVFKEIDEWGVGGQRRDIVYKCGAGMGKPDELVGKVMMDCCLPDLCKKITDGL